MDRLFRNNLSHSREMLAPIVLFVYNRPMHTQQTIEALKRNHLANQSDLIIFSDGPKKAADEERVRAVREICKNVDGFRSLNVHERDLNFGLSKSIIQGVTNVLETHDRVIVLEDDMITSPHFLKYMNGNLDLYENDDEVISIHAYIYPVAEDLPETYFLVGADCYGWGTWKRGWNLFEEDGVKLLEELESQGLTRSFDFDGTYPYTRMLKNQIAGKTQSWAVRWYASAFLKRRYTLYPGRSLVFNTGFDASGTNCSIGDIVNGEMMKTPPSLSKVDIEENSFAKDAVKRFFRKTQSPLFKAKNRIKGYIGSKTKWF